jgi:hypothetical protein
VPAPEPCSWARAARVSTAPRGAGVKGVVVHANENGTRANGRALVLPNARTDAHASGTGVGKNQVLFCHGEGERTDQRGEAERLQLEAAGALTLDPVATG